MACFKLQYKDTSRYQLQYPLTRGDDNLYVVADTPLEASYQFLKLQDTDAASFTFDRPFTGIPHVVAGFVALSPLIGNPSVNVYVESVTATGGVVRTSAPVIIAAVAVHAIYTGETAP